MLRPTLVFLLAACAPKVSVEVPAAPTVALNTVTLRVIAADRACRPVADEVVERLHHVPGMRVDPAAWTTLTMYGCTSTIAPGVDGVDASSTALAALSEPSGVVHLLGSARDSFEGVPTRKSIEQLDVQVAQDMVEQIVPLPLTVRRRVYGRAGSGSAKDLQNRAVRAEQDGRLTEALEYATQAYEMRPRPERARYVAELTRRISRTE